MPEMFYYIGLSNRIFATANGKKKKKKQKKKIERKMRDASGYGPIDREVERYDIIVTNIESILYYCTSIFVIINPNRVTRGNERGIIRAMRRDR